MNPLHIDNFDFNLPEELISHNPLKNREEARLLYVNGGEIADKKVADLVDLLNAGDLLVFNNTKVIPARLIGKKTTGAIINITLHYRLDNKHWLAFIKNSKRLHVGDIINIADNFQCTVMEKLNDGEVKLFFDYDNLFAMLDKYGFMPLPPYIKRENINVAEDKTNYQSIFAKYEGAVAAPTASLHFTEELIAKLQAKGVKIAFLTLHVGAGTFLPVKVENILEHKMHKEYGELPQETIETIHNTKKNGGKVIVVGTTAMRVLEYVAKENNGELKPFSGEIDLFIYEGFKFHVVDKLITNFHLPKSTLFMLVSAFAGLQNMKNAYHKAIEQKYRFFSYGDCCLLEKN